MPYTPPASSVPVLDGIDFSKAADFLSNWKQAFDDFDAPASNKDPSKCKALMRFPDGTLFFEAKASVCADGWLKAANGDPTGQPKTSTTLEDAATGKQVPFDATIIPYIVLPKGSFDLESGLPILNLGVVIYKDKHVPAIYCEHGPLAKIGEISIRAHERLGQQPWANAAHTKIINSSIDDKVLYFVFPNSQITHPTLTTDNAVDLIEKRGEEQWTAFKARYGKGTPAPAAAVAHVGAAAAPAQAPAPGPAAAPAPVVTPVIPFSTRALQEKLCARGLYDQGALDGQGGPFTRWALAEFQRAAGIIGEAGAGPLTQAALNEPPEKWFPLNPGNDLAGKIVRAMLAKGHWVNRHEQCLNIVYVEGMSPNGSVNNNESNRFNDLRLLVGVRGGVPVVIDSWGASTEPGRYYTEHPENPLGAARIEFGQYYAWNFGHHKSSNHPALVQVGDVTVCRDLNKDYSRKDDQRDTDSDFGINQHWGYDYPVDDIVNASAGCLVGRTIAGHKQFMELVTSDPRFQASSGYRFTTTILPAAEVANA